MVTIPRRIVAVSALVAMITVGSPPLHAQAPKPVPGVPYQMWDVLEADGGARKVYVRNDGGIPLTITKVVIQRCDNTRQECGSYPANLVIAPGKTAVVFKAERLDSGGGQPLTFLRATGPTLLTAASLGVPQDVIAKISKECGHP